ncbi:MAG: 30S ribosomal protein S20 [Elusimicrobiales bacterium]
MAKLKTGRHTGALKAARQALRRASHNKGVRKTIKLAAKEYSAALKTGDAAKTSQLYGKVSSVVDKAAKKGVIHWKTAARKKSRLAKAAAKQAKPA